MGWLPESDSIDTFQDDGIEPAPDDDVRAVGCGSDGNQVTGSYPFGARCGKGPRVGHHFGPPVGEHGARVFDGAQDDRGSQLSGRFSVSQVSHAPILPNCTGSPAVAPTAVVRTWPSAIPLRRQPLGDRPGIGYRTRSGVPCSGGSGHIALLEPRHLPLQHKWFTWFVILCRWPIPLPLPLP